MGDRRWFYHVIEFNMPAAGEVEVLIRVKSKYLGPKDFFVDATCIDCDACRQIAPATFGEARTTSYVRAQPSTEAERRQAWRALVSCPTGSIGDLGNGDPKVAMADFPLVVDSPAGPIDEGVRRRIGRLLPELCTQFVGFTINTERAGFVDALLP